MQRVRIGLTGLAFVFVLVLLAAVFSPTEEQLGEQAITPNTIEQQMNGIAPGNAAAEAEPEEPLAELGVAPGNADAKSGQGNSDVPVVQPQD